MACLCEMIGLACLVALLMSFSNKAPYQLKMAIFFIGSGAIVLICIPFMMLRPRDYKNAFGPAWGCRQLCKALGVTMEVRGMENIRKDNGSVVLMNHQSALDLLDSINALQKESKAINERGCKLLLFPEGTRNSRDTLLPFKKGSFHIALQSQCPIQPVVISKYWFLNSEEKIFRPGHAIIHILPEIPTAGCTKDDMDALIEKTRNIMQSEYTKLSQEAKAINSKKQN
ncbi:hypothetical protein DOY81_015346 [Sarcophaga bullata]|nr:hypothetical protein DOY81_015346 [Sarcophaga bullata]